MYEQFIFISSNFTYKKNNAKIIIFYTILYIYIFFLFYNF